MLKSIKLHQDAQSETGEDQLEPFRKRATEAISIRKENRDKLFKKRREIPGERENWTSDTQPFFSQIYQLLQRRFSKREFSVLVEKLKSDQLLEQMEGAIGIKRLLSVEDTLNDRAIAEGAVDTFISIAEKSEVPQLLFESTWALVNVAAGNESQCGYLIDHNCISIFTELLRSSRQEVLVQCLYFFSNIACDFPFYCNKFIQSGAFGMILNLLSNSQEKLILQYAAYTISYISRKAVCEEGARAVAPLCLLLAEGHIEDEETFTSCCWAIQNNCAARKEEEKWVVETNLFVKLVDIVKESNNPIVAAPCLKLVVNLIDSKAKVVEKLIEAGVLDALEKVLKHQRKSFRLKACNGFASIAARKPKQVLRLLDRKETMKLLASRFQEENSEEVRLELATTFCNMCSHDRLPVDIDTYLIDLGIVPHFEALLTSKSPDVIVETLKGLQLPLDFSKSKQVERGAQNLFAIALSQCGIVRTIQALQNHNDNGVYECTLALLEAYFLLEDPLSACKWKQEPKKKSTSYGVKWEMREKKAAFAASFNAVAKAQ